MPVQLPMYSLIEVVNTSVRRVASNKKTCAFYLFSSQDLAQRALGFLGDDELRPVEHADQERLANFLEELEAEHGLAYVVVDPDLQNKKHAWDATIREMIAQLRDL